MKFSPAERLIVVMLAEVLEKVGGHSEIDPSFVKSAALSNNEWAITWDHGWLSEDSCDPSVVKETTDIMNAWLRIERSVDGLSKSERGALIADVGDESWIKFDGFDGNNDDHYGVATFIVEEMNRFGEFKGRSLNSHSSASIDRHRETLRRLRGIGHHDLLSVDDLKKIFKQP
ncbi:YfbU family protein [Xanthobacter aminoxidans]|uniref:YfbU family protein n=1 Tax=Xanthobacter aminoxidans TaxID=186280 RepID=UPI002022E7BA|nr:YfbU family protein [Xanthobacter aminoxidans]